jgi:hypothetical protein
MPTVTLSTVTLSKEGFTMTRRRYVLRGLLAFAACLLLGPALVSAGPVVVQAAGPDPESITPVVEVFREALGDLNPNVAGSFPSGRREINWDGVPDAFAAPNLLPPDFFNVNSPRGAVFETPGSGVQVSANQDNPTGTPIEFGNINPTYPELFRTFSPQRLFTALDSTVTEVRFFVPGSTTPATVSGFGAVFTDVDRLTSTKIEYIDAAGQLLFRAFVQPLPGRHETLSFLGVRFEDGERIAKVRITSGNANLSPNTFEGPLDSLFVDLVVMDDFIYGEPQAIDGKPHAAR